MKATYANQKAIVINRTLPKKGERKKFLSAYYDSITLAARTLSGEVRPCRSILWTILLRLFFFYYSHSSRYL